jgi:glycosyltransferase involved in cell wall biosynthesis
VEGAFTFTGYVSFEDLPALYEQMSLFVAPVHTESFGHVSPCAMGMKMPVVGYDVGALKEITGNCNLLAPAGDSDTLADMIIELLNDRERRLKIGARNRDRAERLFSIEAMIDGYSALYNGLIGSDSLRLINRTCGQASLQKGNSAFLD